MKRYIFILLVFAGCLSSCKDKDYYTKKDFPKWLIAKIDEIETTNSNDIAIVKIRISKGEWKDNVTYFIKNNLTSCLFCEIYYENGEKVILLDNAISDFSSKSENWEIIYEFGNGLIN
jgi:hypothetical protein